MLNFLSLLEDVKTANSIDSIAIGKFDGLHIAHNVIFSFLGDNGIILSIESDNGILLPKQYRDFYVPNKIYNLHLDVVRNNTCIEFVSFLIKVLPNLKRIVVGYDFRFGKNRNYYTFDLQKAFSGEVIIVDEVFYKKLSVHSGLIKELLISGNLKQANKLLGRYYEIRGNIIKGQGLGSKRLYATINIQNDGFLVLQEGVYAGYVQLGNQNLSTPFYPAVIFIGNRVSTDKCFSIEGHLLGVQLEVSDDNAGFYFVKKIRDNKYFDELEDLKMQISNDISEAQRILKIQKCGVRHG